MSRMRLAFGALSCSVKRTQAHTQSSEGIGDYDPLAEDNSEISEASEEVAACELAEPIVAAEQKATASVEAPAA